ncbi:MAG: IS66 family insertion sequence element accessory protein TnpB [Sulfitobacter sp.]
MFGKLLGMGFGATENVTNLIKRHRILDPGDQAFALVGGENLLIEGSLVQEGLGRDPHAGEIFCFRGRKGDLVKILWHDGVGMSLYLKRLEAGKFIWPVSRSGEAVQISAAQLGYLLEGIDWRNPRWTQRPAKAG